MSFPFFPLFNSRNAKSPQVGLYVYQPPCGREAALGAPRDVVTLAAATCRAGLFIAAPPQPDAAALVPGSAVMYRVGGGRWALVARDCLPRRPLHLAISLFTDTAAAPGAHAVAVLNPGPHFAFPPPSAEELAEAAGRGALDGDGDDSERGRCALLLPAPRALCELGLGAEEWMAQREAAAAPAEPEGEQYEDDEDSGARSGEEEIAARPADAAAPAAVPVMPDAEAGGGNADDGTPPPLTGVALLLAAAAAAAAARLGLTIPLPSDDAL